MSDRDPLYNPGELLKTATPDHILTPEEQNAFDQYNKLLQQLSSATDHLNHCLRLLQQFPQSKAPKIHACIQEEIDEATKNINQLHSDISQSLDSDHLQCIVDRIYQELIPPKETHYPKQKAIIKEPPRKAFSTKTFLFGTIVLVIAVIISWYVALSFFSDVTDAHYPNGSTVVQITSTGSKYHLSSCSYLHSSSIDITLKKASERGYEPCSRCDPPDYISIAEYRAQRDNQPIVLMSLLVLISSIPISCCAMLIISGIGRFIIFFDELPEWFFVVMLCAIYITALIQGFRIIIIW